VLREVEGSIARLRIRGTGAALVAALAAVSLAPANAQTDADPSDEQTHCLALAMYWESRSEGPEGMRAVGSVVLNRVESEDFPGTPCAVVYDGGETPPCQFSWWCDGLSDRPSDVELWQTALDVAAALLTDRGDDPTQGALFFHSADIDVPWRVERTRTVQILDHIYYR
jgi:spore germination cell wall hydrolase CwlJ-like protein